MTASVVRSAIIGILALFAVIFIPAGTLNYWQGWVFVAGWVAYSSAYIAYLMKHDPALLKRRSEVGLAYEKEPVQRAVVPLLFAASIALGVLAPLDARFGWSNMPWYVSVFGDVLLGVAFYLFYLVSKVNTYAAGSVRVEEGQRVISTGLYGVVRHPMYSAALLLFAAAALALGSWWALLLMPIFTLLLYLRIVNEENVLKRDLDGYEEYTRKVRYRLIPGIF